MIENITGVILAGGKSRRIGTDKAFLKIREKTIIEEIVNKLKNIFKEILIVSNEVNKFKFLRVPVIKDIIPHKGPLGGIYTGLMHSNNFYNFFIACDMPFINKSVIELLLKNINGYDVVVPEYKGKIHTLYAIYSKNCIKQIEIQLSKENLKILDFLRDAKTKIIKEDEIKKINSKGLCFTNINTPLDYEKILKYIELY